MLRFLREKAFPTWDFFDASARRRPLEEYPGAQIAEDVARRLRDLGPFNPHMVPPTMFRPDCQISVMAVRPPQPPKRGLFGGLQRHDTSVEARDTGTRVMALDLSALGPFACATWMWPAGGLDPPLNPRSVEAAVLDLLREQGIVVLTREEILIPVRGMKGTPYSKEGRVPNVCNCLFDAASFLLRGLGVSQFRAEAGEGDLWPRAVEGRA
ncbi:MAG TPA: hypothetical protein HA326_01955 [Thermoplasmata archaeon]|nr:hypothetical protein [Thermoplasmata archaeon]